MKRENPEGKNRSDDGWTLHYAMRLLSNTSDRDFLPCPECSQYIATHTFEQLKQCAKAQGA